jgi:hypothetical protein
MYLDLTIPSHAYMFGFIQMDGSLYESTRNRGKLQVEIKSNDDFILKEFQKLVSCFSSISYRTRKTNFSESITTATFRICDLDFRKEIISYGMIVGKKDLLVDIPNCPFSVSDYFRGVVDANGSLGVTKLNLPFVSLTTKSENLANSYIKYIQSIIGKIKTTSRNTRDSVFNIAVFREDAQLLVKNLYYEDCLALPRKIESSKDVISWVRPDNIIRRDPSIYYKSA